MFGNNKFDQIKRFQAGMLGNPMENSPQGFLARMNMGPNIGPKFNDAMNGCGPYQNIAENTPTGFKQRQQFFNDKLNDDFKSLIPEIKPIEIPAIKPIEIPIIEPIKIKLDF